MAWYARMLMGRFGYICGMVDSKQD